MRTVPSAVSTSSVAVVEGHDLDVVGQAGAHGLQALFDAPHDVAARGAAQHEHDAGDALSRAVAGDGALADLRADLDGRDLTSA